MGLRSENLTARTIGELLWAIGWEPIFEAKEIVRRDRANDFVPSVTSEVSTAEDFTTVLTNECVYEEAI